MANQGQDLRRKAGEWTGQAQMKADEMFDQSSNTQQQTNFLQQTGEQVKNMAQGAANVAQGAVHGAASMAQGAALGAANVAQGAADAVKNTLGMNNDHTSSLPTSTNPPPHSHKY